MPGESVALALTGATVTTAVDVVTSGAVVVAGALAAVVVGGVAMDAAATRACGRSISICRPDDGT